MEKTIVFELNDDALASELKRIGGENAHRIDRNAFDGSGEAISIVLILAPLILREVSKIIQKGIEAKKHVKVFYNGKEIEGVSEKTLLKLLEEDISIIENKESEDEND